MKSLMSALKMKELQAEVVLELLCQKKVVGVYGRAQTSITPEAWNYAVWTVDLRGGFA